VAVRFEWDAKKARNNLTKHGVAFDEAVTVFYDGLSVTIADPEHSADEDRSIIVGHSSRNRLMVVVHVEDGNTIRIISAREATARERRVYEEGR
jgi:uncharacterized DUF497 family protein